MLIGTMSDNKMASAIDYDAVIERALQRWQETGTTEIRLVKKAMYYHLAAYLYDQVRTKLLGDQRAANGKYWNDRFTSLGEVLLHLIGSALWITKWILLNPTARSSSFLIVSINSKKVTTRSYLFELIKYAKHKNAVVVNFGTLATLHGLSDRRVFCFPAGLRTIFQSFSPDRVELKNVMSEFDEIVMHEMGLNIDSEVLFKSHWYLYNRLLRGVHDFLSVLRKYGKVIGLFTETDFTKQKVFLVQECKRLSIPTITTDDGLFLYDHLFQDYSSDHYVAWGDFQLERIRRMSKSPPIVHVFGRPDVSFASVSFPGKKFVWLYFLPAFQNPIAQTIHRSLSRSLKTIRKIEEVSLSNRPIPELLVRSHPRDNPNLFQWDNVNFVRRDISLLLQKTQLIFVEDSTVAIELLKYDIPIIFIADKTGKDTFGFEETGAGMVLRGSDEYDVVIRKSLDARISEIGRHQVFQYYFGNNSGFSRNMGELLQNVLLESKPPQMRSRGQED